MSYWAEHVHQPGVINDDVLAHNPFKLQSTSWYLFPKKILHPCWYSSEKALGLEFILLATCSRNDSVRDWCQGFQRNFQVNFSLNAYLILEFGDIPAMVLIMHIKGQNSICPCQICKIKGVCFESCTHYVPLRQDKISGANPPQYDTSHLPICTNEKLLEQAREVEMAPNNVTCEQLSKKYGIQGIPVLRSISSISFPSSFPFDFMHLIWENLICNLIEFWTSTFKDLDHQDKDYFI